MTNKPKYAIVNTTDAPQRRMVCELVGYKYYYMLRAEDDLLKSCDGMEPSRPTGIEEFGFDIEESDYAVSFVQVRFSAATYEDGEIRQWQDRYRTHFLLPRVRLTARDKARANRKNRSSN